MGERLRVGLLGMGMIGVQHAAALHDLRDHVELRAYTGSSPDGAARAGWPDAERVSRDELYARDDVDIIVICTPSDGHATQALEALGAGKHVVVEKPFALNVADAERINALASERGLHVSAIFQRRFEPVHQEVRALMDRGKLGELRLARTHVHWWRDPEYYREAPWRGRTDAGGSALDNQGIHNVDLLRWFAGPVEAVTAQSATLAHDIEAADTFVATLSFANGALGLLSVTTATPPGFPATISLNFDRGAIELGPEEILRWDHDAPRPEVGGAHGAGGSSEPMAFGVENHVAQWRDIIGAIHAGRPSSISGTDAAQTVRLTAAIALAADTGRRVRPADLS